MDFDLDTVRLAILVVVAVIVIIYLIRWWRVAGTWRDSQDDHARGCLNVIDFGCWTGCLLRLATLALFLRLLALF